MGPHNLPLRSAPFIHIGVPVTLPRDVSILNNDFELGLVAHHRGAAVDANRDCYGLQYK